MSPHNASNGDHQVQPVQQIPLAYDNADDQSATKLILALFPEWKDGEGGIEFTKFKDGITNTVRQITQILCQSS